MAFTLAFLAALALNSFVQLWLAARQVRHVQAHAHYVPAQFKGRIGNDAHRKAAAYTVAKTRLGMWELVLSAAVVLLWTLGGGLEMLAQLWHSFAISSNAWRGAGLILSVFFITALIQLPMDLVATFGIEQRFGFNRTTAATYCTDQAKKAALGVLLGGPAAALVVWLMDSLGSLWWLAAWGAWLTINLIAFWAFPVFIAPLFNRFTPLRDEALAERIAKLLKRHGFRASGIFVTDGSKRSSHGNAYFTGLGSSKRIVFYDTLLAELDTDEVEAVLAHEVGHFKLKHILKQLAVGAASIMASLALLAWLAEQAWFYTSLGVSTAGTAQALVLFLMVAPAFFFFLGPLSSALSRRHEYEADAFAAENCDGATLVRALVKLYRTNASTLTPDPLYSAFHDSHPSAPQRVAHLEAYVPSN
ncbi:MAG: M48 family metalloprotease [Gammaproteobacteria bacterium]|nr:M48 family metalloprotease [Gammaproteobacteria bacterium]